MHDSIQKQEKYRKALIYVELKARVEEKQKKEVTKDLIIQSKQVMMDEKLVASKTREVSLELTTKPLFTIATLC